MKSTRPAKCAECGEQMYYAGDPQHEPEVEVVISARQKYTPDGINIGMVSYVHLRCFSGYSVGKVSEIGESIIEP